jgi:hypothetical protein
MADVESQTFWHAAEEQRDHSYNRAVRSRVDTGLQSGFDVAYTAGLDYREAVHAAPRRTIDDQAPEQVALGENGLSALDEAAAVAHLDASIAIIDGIIKRQVSQSN